MDALALTSVLQLRYGAVEYLLRVENINKNFGGVKTLTAVGFEIANGQILGLLGPNGAGKTTIFNVISGIYRADSGHVFLEAEETTNRSPTYIANSGVARTFQVARTFNDMTVEANLRVGLVKSRLPSRAEVKRVHEILEMTGLGGVSDQVVAVLPDGQKKLVELARAIMRRPKLLILDEPFAGVSQDVIDLMISLIKTLSADGVGCLAISHDISSMPRLCEEVLVLVDGQVLTRGAISNIRNDQRVVEAYLGA
jgi:branched-chain amino acid transport system ATP-binding protein